MITIQRARAAAFLFVFSFLLSSTSVLTQPSKAYAIDCNGSLTSEDCLHTSVGTISGRYRSVIAGDGVFEDNSGGSMSLTIPNCLSGTPAVVQATLSWAIRDTDFAYWEDGVDISVDAGATTSVTHDRRYKSNPDAQQYSSYSASITSQVLPGTHTYDVTNIDTSGNADFLTTQWGFGIQAVYECPEFDLVDIYQKDGLDLAWRGWGAAWANDRTELTCQAFAADTMIRTVTLDAFLPGAFSATREADIWYKTGTGAAPGPTDYDLLTDVNTAANGGLVLDRLVLTSDDPEWDSYQNTTVSIPAGAEYLCFQIDTSFNTGEHPDNASAAGASMFAGGMWFSVPQSTNVLSLGDKVWDDVNNNGMFDAGEVGICGVDVHLYADLGADGKYDSGVEGTSPMSTTTTSCGGSLGDYSFSGLAPGDYIVVIPQSELDGGGTLEGYTSSTGTNGSATGAYEQAPDPDNNINGDDNGFLQAGDGIVSCAVTLAIGAEPTDDGDSDTDTNMSIDFGVFRGAKLGDYVWYDANGDGVQDAGETGVANVTATLFDADTDTEITSMPTDSEGAYQFCYLIAGNYYVEFTDLPADYFLTENDGTDEATDSDVIPSTNRTEVFTLSIGQVLPDVDGGIQQVLGDLSEATLADTGSATFATLVGMGVISSAAFVLVLKGALVYSSPLLSSIRGDKV